VESRLCGQGSSLCSGFPLPCSVLFSSSLAILSPPFFDGWTGEFGPCLSLLPPFLISSKKPVDPTELVLWTPLCPPNDPRPADPFPSFDYPPFFRNRCRSRIPLSGWVLFPRFRFFPRVFVFLALLVLGCSQVTGEGPFLAPR